MRVLKMRMIVVFLAISIAGCAKVQEVRISTHYNLCTAIPDGWSWEGPDQAHDFEVTSIRYDSSEGTIYVGDFPDYPGFNPNNKFSEPEGKVTYIGQAMKSGVRGFLYRFGVGGQPSVHVLVQMPEEAKSLSTQWSNDVVSRVFSCD
jgi:hypothetical protein